MIRELVGFNLGKFSEFVSVLIGAILTTLGFTAK
jgi:hypothetical protein